MATPERIADTWLGALACADGSHMCSGNSPPFTPKEALRPQPDWPRVHAELRRPGVTLMLLWQEYRAGQPEGYGYSRFCDLYAEWRGSVSVTMRQAHVAGDKLFVDFAGQTLAVVDPATGQVRPAQVFVAVLGASSLTYAEVRWSQGLADWVGCHVKTALERSRSRSRSSGTTGATCA